MFYFYWYWIILFFSHTTMAKKWANSIMPLQIWSRKPLTLLWKQKRNGKKFLWMKDSNFFSTLPTSWLRHIGLTSMLRLCWAKQKPSFRYSWNYFYLFEFFFTKIYVDLWCIIIMTFKITGRNRCCCWNGRLLQIQCLFWQRIDQIPTHFWRSKYYIEFDEIPIFGRFCCFSFTFQLYRYCWKFGIYSCYDGKCFYFFINISKYILNLINREMELYGNLVIPQFCPIIWFTKYFVMPDFRMELSILCPPMVQSLERSLLHIRN